MSRQTLSLRFLQRAMALSAVATAATLCATGAMAQETFKVGIVSFLSGQAAESFGIPLVSAEIECVAAGGTRCRFVMAPPVRIEEHLARQSAEAGDDTHARLLASTVAASGTVPVPEFFHRLRMEEELRQANELLERRVLARTTELSQANQHLEHEIAERRLAEEQLRRQALHDALTGG
mgnify:CR=1 FL=1